MDLAARHHRQLLVEQRRERAQDAAFRLTAQPEQDEIVPRQNRVDDLRNNRLFVTDDPGEERVAAFELLNEVVANFVFDRAVGKARGSKFAECRRNRHVSRIQETGDRIQNAFGGFDRFERFGRRPDRVRA
jgi:hypothetical protein